MPAGRRPRSLVRAVIATFAAFVGAVASSFGNIQDPRRRPSVILPAVGGALLLLIAGVVAVRAIAFAVRRGTSEKVGEVRGATLAKVTAATGYVIVGMWTLSALGVGIQALLLGGALTGVIVGIAAQQTLGNVFAGMVLMAVRPFTAGKQTVLKTGLGEYEGTVTNLGLFYVSILTRSGTVEIPNAVALASAVGPGARSGPPEEGSDDPSSEAGLAATPEPSPVVGGRVGASAEDAPGTPLSGPAP